MEVYGVKPIESAMSYPNQASGQTELSGHQPSNGQGQGQVAENLPTKELTPEKINEATDEMNSIVKTLNTNIQFKLHEKTNNLMVQVVDIKDGKVLKEFPPHEMLDVMAKIKEFVGALIDKKV